MHVVWQSAHKTTDSVSHGGRGGVIYGDEVVGIRRMGDLEETF